MHTNYLPHRVRLHEFLRRRARLQRVDEAVRRNIVIGFFDTVFWSRKFQRHCELRRAGRMTDIPQLNIPEILIDDHELHEHEDQQRQHGHARGGSEPSSITSSPQIRPDSGPLPLPPLDVGAASQSTAYVSPMSSTGFHQGRPRASSSIQATPVQSPTRPRAPTSPTRAGGASYQRDSWGPTSPIDRPVSPLGVERAAGERDRAGRRRAESNVSAQDVLDVLDNSAWGESIRKSFSTRRGPGSGGRRRGKSFGGDDGEV